MKPRAYVLVKRHVEARFEAFCEGFKAAGYQIVMHEPRLNDFKPGDVMATWNRKPPQERIADRFEALGGTVLVAENGYLGRDEHGGQYYALARHAHNGRGEWPVGGPERWVNLGIELKPWRADGEHILICPNRHIGMRGSVMPQGWAETVAGSLKRYTRRPIRIRPHPGHWKRLPVHPDVTLANDLRNAWAVVVWSSSAGVKALAAGIPVIQCCPWWIASGAAGNDFADIEDPAKPDRWPVFCRLAWAQWSAAEIVSGAAFRALLQTEQAEAA